MKGALAERNFRLFFTGYTTSLIGSAMVSVALSFAVLDQGGSATDVGWVLAAHTVPLILLLLVGGVVADRISRRVVMLGSDLLCATSEAGLAVLLLRGHPPLVLLVALAAGVGVGEAFFSPALTGLMPEIVPEAKLQQANALRGISQSGAAIIGPSLAGVLIAVADPGWCIAIDSASYLVSALCLSRLLIPPRAATERQTMLKQLAEGWEAFRSRDWLWAIVAQFATYNALCMSPFMVLGAVTAKRHLGGAGAWGAILASLGGGSIVGGLVATRLRPRRPLVHATFGAAVLAVPLFLVAIPAPTVLIAAGAALAGFGLAQFGTLWETALQQHVPREVLARVSAYDYFGSVAFIPLGFILAGPISGAIGTRTTLFLAGGWALASCAAVLITPGVRHLGPGGGDGSGSGSSGGP
jgi:MFS family permease